MGRRLKFGEKTKWVSVRVPESKIKIARILVREFVEILFIHLERSGNQVLEKFIRRIFNLLGERDQLNENNTNFRSFREFINQNNKENN